MTEAWWFLQPGNLILVLVAGALLCLAVGLRKLAGFMLFVTLTIALLPTAFGAADWLGWQLERQVAKPASLPASIDGIIILGGAVEWLITGEQQQLNLNAAGERMMAGAALARQYPQARVVLTGLYRETIPADFTAAVRPQSMLAGPEFAGRNVTFIGAARSTYEEGLMALETVNPGPDENWLLVTSAMHMPRAAGVFGTLGWSVIPWPVDYRAPVQPRLLNLNMNFSDRLAHFDAVVREWAALIVYRNTGRITQ